MTNCTSKSCEQINPQNLDQFKGCTGVCISCLKRQRKEAKVRFKNTDAYKISKRKEMREYYRRKRQEKIRKGEVIPRISLSEEELYRRKFNREIFRKYGLTMEQYDRLYKEQEGRCHLCGSHESTLKKRLHVDHCHKTNVVRGLLCTACNVGIGLLKEDPIIFLKAIDYLKNKVA